MHRSGDGYACAYANMCVCECVLCIQLKLVNSYNYQLLINIVTVADEMRETFISAVTVNTLDDVEGRGNSTLSMRWNISAFIPYTYTNFTHKHKHF